METCALRGAERIGGGVWRSGASSQPSSSGWWVGDAGSAKGRSVLGVLRKGAAAAASWAAKGAAAAGGDVKAGHGRGVDYGARYGLPDGGGFAVGVGEAEHVAGGEVAFVVLALLAAAKPAEEAGEERSVVRCGLVAGGLGLGAGFGGCNLTLGGEGVEVVVG